MRSLLAVVLFVLGGAEEPKNDWELWATVGALPKSTNGYLYVGRMDFAAPAIDIGIDCRAWAVAMDDDGGLRLLPRKGKNTEEVIVRYTKDGEWYCRLGAERRTFKEGGDAARWLEDRVRYGGKK